MSGENISQYLSETFNVVALELAEHVRSFLRREKKISVAQYKKEAAAIRAFCRIVAGALGKNIPVPAENREPMLHDILSKISGFVEMVMSPTHGALHIMAAEMKDAMAFLLRPRNSTARLLLARRSKYTRRVVNPPVKLAHLRKSTARRVNLRAELLQRLGAEYRKYASKYMISRLYTLCRVTQVAKK